MVLLALQEVDHPDDLRAALRGLGYDSEFAQRPNGRQVRQRQRGGQRQQ